MTTQNADDALREFDVENKAEDVEPASSFNPSIKMHDEDGANIGLYVSGRYLSSREIVNNGTKLMFIDVRLEKTNAKATIKKGKAFPEVTVKAGDIVTVYASSRLYRAAKQLQPGTRVFFEYEGQKKVETPKGKKLAHIYKVKSLPGNLTPEDVSYLQSKTKKVVSEADVDASKKGSEADAESALNTLEE